MMRDVEGEERKKMLEAIKTLGSKTTREVGVLRFWRLKARSDIIPVDVQVEDDQSTEDDEIWCLRFAQTPTGYKAQ